MSYTALAPDTTARAVDELDDERNDELCTFGRHGTDSGAPVCAAFRWISGSASRLRCHLFLVREIFLQDVEHGAFKISYSPTKVVWVAQSGLRRCVRLLLLFTALPSIFPSPPAFRPALVCLLRRPCSISATAASVVSSLHPPRPRRS